MYYSVLYTLTNSKYGKIYQDKSFIEISDECREIAEIIEPQSWIGYKYQQIIF